MDQKGSEENHKLNEFPNLDSFVIHTCVITVACSPVMHSIDFNWTFQAVQPLACKNWIQWEQWGFVYVQGTRRSSQNESLFGESKAFYDWTQLSPGLAQRFKICLKEGLAVIYMIIHTCHRYMSMPYAYMPTSFLPMIEKLPWHWFWCILTLLATIFNEVMPKSLRVMDRFRRFRGHCRLYYVDPLNSFWRLAYCSRATWSVGHFDAFLDYEWCKGKDVLTVKRQSGALALPLPQPGNLFRWGTSWDGWIMFPDPRLFSEPVDFPTQGAGKQLRIK